MSDTVVSLRGEPIRPPGEVNPEVVAIAEEILEMARGGEIHTLTAVFTHADECVGCRQRGTGNYRLVGMLMKVVHDILAGMD